ncbi:Glutathione S-transferase F13-like protein [Drosera capensis]
MALKLHGLGMSTCTSRVRICLYEKEVDFEFVVVDLLALEHKQPEFLSKNPFGQVPVLEDGDLTLFESRAITKYIATKHKDQGYDLIRDVNPTEAAMVNVWLEVEAHRYHPHISNIIYHTLVYPVWGKPGDQAIIDAGVEELKKVIDIYEERLSKSKYLAGDFYSLADLHHIPYTYYLIKTPYADVITSRPHVKAWWDDITSRPASQKVLVDMVLADAVYGKKEGNDGADSR